MIVYNITVKIAAAIETDWVQWQKQEHIPDIMATGLFAAYRFYKLLTDEPDEEGPTYVVQYDATDFVHYQRYIDAHAPLLRKKAFDKWGDQFIAFRSLLEVVN
jgi:hypothetical protein